MKSNDDITCSHIFTISREKSKPFKCIKCALSCASKTDLEKHIKVVHEGLKPYKCNFCERFFSTKGNLDRHLGMKQRNLLNVKSVKLSLIKKGMWKNILPVFTVEQII